MDPGNAQAFYNRGVAKTNQERYEDAIADYDEAIRLKPDYLDALINRGGVKDTFLGRHAEAIADYDEAIRLDPGNAQAFYNRGVAKTNHERYEDAIADYDEAIRLDPNYVDALNNRDGLKDALGRHAEAIADYDEAIRLDPGNAQAFYNPAVAKANPAIMEQPDRSWLERNAHWVALFGFIINIVSFPPVYSRLRRFSLWLRRGVF